MPLPTRDLFLPTTMMKADIDVTLEPAHNVIYSLTSLVKSGHTSGFDDWIYRTAERLTPDEREAQQLVMIGLHYAVTPLESWPTFPAYMDYLASVPPEQLRDQVLDMYRHLPCQDSTEASAEELWSTEEILADVNTFLRFLRQRFESQYVDEDLERQAYTYLLDPPALQQLIVGHLRHMWHKYMAVEWERVRPTLQQAVQAFEQVDLGPMSRREAAEFIVGTELDDPWWETIFDSELPITFIPSVHIGPYTGRFFSDDHFWVVFGARQPEGSEVEAPELTRAEILVRLNALADDTRLSILKMAGSGGEQRSQDIIDNLGLSQSAASRHLKQLTATGLLEARRCNGAKCYRINPQRVDRTLEALANYLSVKPEFWG